MLGARRPLSAGGAPAPGHAQREMVEAERGRTARGTPTHTRSVGTEDRESCGVRSCVPQQRGMLVVSDKAFDFAV